MSKKNLKNFGIRTLDIESGTIDVEKRTVVMSISSETPYKRYDCEIGEYWEILGHQANEIDFTRLKNKAPLLNEHDPSQRLGVIEDVWLDNKQRKVYIKGRFSKNTLGSEVFQDVIDGICNKLSVGYEILEAIITKMSQEGGTEVRVIKWRPYEGSIVSIPADDSVGVLRSMSEADQKRKLEVSVDLDYKLEPIENEKNQDENNSNENLENTLPPVIESEVEPIVVENTQENKENIAPIVENEILESDNNTQEQSDKKVDTEFSRSDNLNITIKENYKMTIQELLARAKAYNLPEDSINAFLRTGADFSTFDAFILTEQAKAPKANLGDLAQTSSEIKNYNLFRAINAHRTGAKSDETELSKFLAEQNGQDSSNLIIPMAYWKKAMVYSATRSVRAYNSAPGDASGVDNLVAEVLDAGNFIDLLRHTLVATKLGVRTVGGLVGNYAVPYKVSGSSNTWVGDSGASTESSAVFDKLTATPKQLVSETQLFELAMKQTTPDAQMLAMDDMIKSRRVELDRVIFWGSGTGNQPTGIANTTGVNTISMGTNGGALTRDTLIDLQASLGSLDVDVDNARYVSNYKVKAALQKLKADAGSGMFVYNEFSDRFATTNNVPSNLTKGTGTGLSGLIFGTYDDVSVMEWGVPELIVDNITQAKYGKQNIFMRQSTDVLVRRPSAFTVIKDIIA